DDDGLPEILFGTDKGTLYGFNHDGTGLTDSTGLLYEVVFPSGAPRIWGPVAVADLESDGTTEIVFGCWNDSLYVIHADGADAPGFPRGGTNEFRRGAVLGDLDADGTLEILAGNRDGSIYAFNHDGSDYVPGGVLATLPGEIRGTLALANLDGDAELECLVACLDGNLYGYHHDGVGLVDPGGLFALIDTTNRSVCTPIVVDVDGDLDHEVFVGHHNGSFYGFAHDGAPLPGFPYGTGLEILSTAAAGDLDGDGDVEIAFASYDQTVNVLDFSGPATPAALEWATLGGNAGRNSVYGGTVLNPTTVTGPGSGSVGRELHPSAPNPFRGETRLRLSLPASGSAELDVFDVSGRRVRTVWSGPLGPGRHDLQWDGRDAGGRRVAAGVYFYRLRTDDGVRTRKGVLLR
ncbi:MAG: T9SS type A sorting domain-containing protein, partial [Gemmatimonadetes bacterium]|nr:T9SS type A sorting domain-containing protein [Gemmatimonadota bacterium]